VSAVAAMFKTISTGETLGSFANTKNCLHRA
jgi:hypothetical protein